MKKIALSLFVFSLFSCAEMQQVLDQLPQGTEVLSQAKIGNGLKEDLTDYTTNKAMEGVFKMIAVEEKEIRTNLNARSSDLLKRVFAMQDKKQ